MSKCEFCGREAGFLRKRHNECQKVYDAGVEKIRGLTIATALGHEPLDTLETQAAAVASQSFIQTDALRTFLIQGWEAAVENALEDGLLSQDEENSLDAYKQKFCFSQDDLDQHGSYIRLVKAGVIRDLLDGKLPERVNISGIIPFNLQKDETLRWLFNNVPYYEERSRTTYTGGYQGASLRIAKGVYYRAGGFRGNPVSTSQQVLIAIGMLGITEKHIYFASPNKSARIPYKKIIAVFPYADGFGIQRDATSAKQQTYVTGDGWFTFNLVQNLAQRAAA